ncbi:MAG: hypothetical protein HC872_05830, partial [Gammaproteobacteria bacterium]|nr:hypothetical protein [Gammaproteobacteria bacterium]
AKGGVRSISPCNRFAGSVSRLPAGLLVNRPAWFDPHHVSSARALWRTQPQRAPQFSPAGPRQRSASNPIDSGRAPQLVQILRQRAKTTLPPVIVPKNQAPLRRHDRHFLGVVLDVSQRMGAITPGRVHLEIAPDVLQRHQHWQLPFQRRLDLIAKAGVDLGDAQFSAEFGRNLEYYTGFVFEVIAPALGPKSPIAGGGRYDDLLADAGAPVQVPAVGASIHTERLLAVLQGAAP